MASRLGLLVPACVQNAPHGNFSRVRGHFGVPELLSCPGKHRVVTVVGEHTPAVVHAVKDAVVCAVKEVA